MFHRAAELVLLTHQGLSKPTPNFFPDVATGSGDGGEAGGLAFVTSLLSLCLARDFAVVLRLPGGACKPWASGEPQGQKLLHFLSHTFVAGLLLPLTVPRGAVLLHLGWDFLSHTIFRLWICIVNLGVLMSRHLLVAPSTCLSRAVAP